VTTDFAGTASALGIELDDEALRLLLRYRDLIAEQTRHLNLTAVREPAAIERRHLLESLAFGMQLDGIGLLGAGQRVIDIGSGAGLPGVPLKIAYPELDVTLLESAGKKCRFLELVRDELRLDGLHVVGARAEEAGREDRHRGAYDLALARAVAPLSVLLEYALPLLKVGGHLAGTKGSALTHELVEAELGFRVLGGELVLTRAFQLPDGLSQTVFVVRKTGETPDAYPRRPGMPGKRPIG
jgi:16S rRNA (guanine527-N7)-methyltransferase